MSPSPVHSFWTCLLVSALGCAGVMATEPYAPAPSDDESMVELVERYTADEGDTRSFWNLSISPTRLEKLNTFGADWQERRGSVPFEDLGVEGRIDHLLLGLHIDHQQQQRDTLRKRLETAANLLPFAQTIIDLEEARWKVSRVDPKAAAETLAKLADEVTDLTERIKGAAKKEDSEAKTEEEEEAIIVTAVLAKRTESHVRELTRALETWHEHFAGFEPGFSWWTEKPFTAAKEALQAYGKKLREEIAELKGEDDDPLVGDPIGRDALLDDLANEMIPYSPEQLLAIGEREFAWCEARLAEASEAMGHGTDWKVALEEVKNGYVPPGEQDDLVGHQAREMLAFLDEHDLVTVPALCRDTWRLTMLSAQRQRFMPFAAYGGQEMLVAYPTAEMEHDNKLQSLRGNNRAFTRNVTPHELIPGHHLQGFMADRHNTHRRLFSTPFYGEGWALYWEMLVWDMGWARNPEEQIGMLFWRLHRAARIVVSLRFHLEQMNPEEMIDYLVDEVGHERDSATSEVRRYIGGNYSPLYQCGYMIGGLQLRALSEELVTHGTYTHKEFHDAVLRCNSIPIEMVRASLTGTLLEETHQSAWLFAGEIEPSAPADSEQDG